MSTKLFLKILLPQRLIEIYQKVVLYYTKMKFKGLNNREAMQLVYKDKWWGGDSSSKFFSGRGSHDKHIIEPYIKAINSFLSDKGFEVIDLGCGDMHVGNHIFLNTKKYIACDIVPELIEFNKERYKNVEKISFECIDIVNDDLPKGDVVIIRQVLQHLSNENIKKVIDKLYDYKFLILTEGIPNKDFESNLDNFTGPDIRLSKNSGIVLDKPPFNLRYKNMKVLLDVKDAKDNALIRTVLFEL